MTQRIKFATVASICLVTALAAPPGSVHAQAPPSTLWSFLGIPQASKFMRNNVINRNGNRPNLEAKPPLKAIADKANAADEEPQAIKTAAKVKQQEDKKKQKIKGLKYLAEVGCGCYPGVAEAFMEAMDPKKECTEEVRYEAVQAVIKAAGNGCAGCGKLGCCNEDLVKKMAELAFLRDEHGCWKEPSDRVREALQEALCLCCPGGVPITVQPTEAGSPGGDKQPKPDPKPHENPADSSPELAPEPTSKTTGLSPSDGSGNGLAPNSVDRASPEPVVAAPRPAPVPVARTGRGSVVRLNPTDNTVEISCPNDEQAIGDSFVTIRRPYLTGTETIGTLAVVSAEPGRIVARSQRLTRPVKRGDEVLLLLRPESETETAADASAHLSDSPDGAPISAQATPDSSNTAEVTLSDRVAPSSADAVPEDAKSAPGTGVTGMPLHSFNEWTPGRVAKARAVSSKVAR